jgi:transposase-like protein
LREAITAIASNRRRGPSGSSGRGRPGISEQTIYLWRRQHLIDTGQLPGTTSSENAELVVARRRIAELEAEVAIHRRTAQLLDEAVSPKDQVKKLATELSEIPLRTGLVIHRTPGTSVRRAHLGQQQHGIRNASISSETRH